MTNKTFCDLCNKEIQKENKIFYLKFIEREINTFTEPYPDVCLNCHDAIIRFIEGELKK